MALRTRRRNGRAVEIDGVSSPAEVTSKLLTSLLNAHYATSPSGDGDASEGPIKVASMQWTPLGRGVMSDVQLLNVSYESTREAGDILSRFLAKFKKEEIPLRDLFVVEGQFYRFASEMKSAEGENNVSEFLFRLVDAVAFGPSWILLEYISTEDMDIIDVHEGCPPERFGDLLVRLARMHAACWLSGTTEGSSKPASAIPSVLRTYVDKLSPAPGAGHTLPPSVRQQQFAPGWPAVRERMMPYFQSEEGLQSLEKMDEIVSWTSQSPRIADFARSVAEKKCTMVHGDFHIGNMLLEKLQHEDSGERKQTAPWLVDWSMAGVGNPCVDLVFFLILAAEAIPTYEIVSTGSASLQSTTEMTTERVGRILKQYYRTLIGEERDEDTANTPPPSNRTQQPRLQWEPFLSMFSECLLNQFIILVCYDSLCRSMADASPDGTTFHDHFDRVNVRCARMLLSEYGMPRLMSERINSSNQ